MLVLLLVAAAAAEQLLWAEEFQTLDRGRWTHLVSGSRGFNKEFQYYRDNRKNSYVRDGILYIRPTLTADDFGEDFLENGLLWDRECNLKPCTSAPGEDILLPILSARLCSENTFAFRYGRLEVRAKLPRGDWIWPAIWLKPKNNAYGPWPASGEIDLVEARGNRKYYDRNVSKGIDTVTSTLHFGPNSSYNIWRLTSWDRRLTNSTYGDDFHLYEMEWTPTSISFKLDGVDWGRQDAPEGGFWHFGGFDQNPGGTNIWADGGPMAPFDQEFYILMNVAVGGTFFADSFVNSDYPRPWNWSSASPLRDFWKQRDKWLPTWNGEDAAMQVDYIRVYVPSNKVKWTPK